MTSRRSILLAAGMAAAVHAQPAPTLADVPYGPHERQKLDFYRAPAATAANPVPLVLFIHGGGWRAGDKSRTAEVGVRTYLDAGISVAAINYRYIQQAQLAGRMPPVSVPVEWPLADAARALQFVRGKAAEWQIDKRRIAATGGSAGACSSLYLAFHDDLADSASEDPIARESTRLWCAAVYGAQTSLDPEQLKTWTSNSRYGGHAFGFWNPEDFDSRDTRFAEFLAKRESVLKWIRMYSPYEHVSADDPPVLLVYRDSPKMGQDQRDPTHTVNLGIGLREHCLAKGHNRCELVYPLSAEGSKGVSEVGYEKIARYLIEQLKAPAQPLSR